MKRAKTFLAKYAFLTLTLMFSVYLYAHVAEKVALIDLPYVDSVATTTIDQKIVLEEVQVPVSDNQKYGFFGAPTVLRIPKANWAVNLFEPKESDAGWILTNTTAGYITRDVSQGGYMGQTIFFDLAGSRNLDILRILVENDRIVIQTNKGYRYHYRVAKRRVLSLDDSYVPASAQTSRIFLVKESDATNEFIVVEANLLNIEEKII